MSRRQRQRDKRPWQEREIELVDRMWSKPWRWTRGSAERARRLWRFWNRDQTRWCTFTPAGRICFGPASRKEASEEAMKRYEAARVRAQGRHVEGYRIEEVFG